MSFKPFVPFEIVWVITNGRTKRKLLWICLRKSGIYVGFGGPMKFHTSYHSSGKFHWKADNRTIELDVKPRLPNILEPVLVQSATVVIHDQAIERFQLVRFDDSAVDRVVYLDNRKLPDAVHYHVWAVPPFEHANVPLMTDHPAHVHIVTHTVPWLQIVIYEQGQRRPRKSLSLTGL